MSPSLVRIAEEAVAMDIMVTPSVASAASMDQAGDEESIAEDPVKRGTEGEGGCTFFAGDKPPRQNVHARQSDDDDGKECCSMQFVEFEGKKKALETIPADRRGPRFLAYARCHCCGH